MAITKVEKDIFRKKNSEEQSLYDTRYHARMESIPVKGEREFLGELFTMLEEYVEASVETCVGGFISLFQDTQKIPTQKEKAWICDLTRTLANSVSQKFTHFCNQISAIELDPVIVKSMQKRLDFQAHEAAAKSLLGFERFCQNVISSKKTPGKKAKNERPATIADAYAIATFSKGVEKITASNGEQYDVFPLELIPTGRFFCYESADIQTLDDLRKLIFTMYSFPEAKYYYYRKKEQADPSLIDTAFSEHRILFTEYKYSYYKRPKYIKDFMQIDTIPEFEMQDWEREIVKISPEYIQITLGLSEIQKRELQRQENIQAFRATENNRPLAFKPKIWGFELDGAKAYQWIKNKWPKIRNFLRISRNK